MTNDYEGDGDAYDELADADVDCVGDITVLLMIM